MKVRKKYHRDFTVTPNEIMRHGLSLKAIGLYLYIISKPDNWDFSIGGTATQVKDGKDSIRSAINELEVVGFLNRSQSRKSNGQVSDGIWYIYDKPSEKPVSVKPTSVNPRQVNTNKVNTKRESNSHSLKIGQTEVTELLNEYGITREALQKVANKYRNWCYANQKVASIAGLRLFLTRERWEIEDYTPQKQMEMQIKDGGY